MLVDVKYLCLAIVARSYHNEISFGNRKKRDQQNRSKSENTYDVVQCVQCTRAIITILIAAAYLFVQGFRTMSFSTITGRIELTIRKSTLK